MKVTDNRDYGTISLREEPNHWSKETRNWKHVDRVYLNTKCTSDKAA